MKPKSSLLRLFRLPTAKEHAQRRLDEHQRELIEARRAAQYAASAVIYHERVIADLQRALTESR